MNKKTLFISAAVVAVLLAVVLTASSGGLLQGNLGAIGNMTQNQSDSNLATLDLIKGDLTSIKADVESLRTEIATLQSKQDITFPSITEKFISFQDDFDSLNARLVLLENK